MRGVGTIRGPLAGGEAPVGVQGLDTNHVYSSGKGPPERLRHQLPGEAWGAFLTFDFLGSETGPRGVGGQVLRQGGVKRLLQAFTPVLGGGGKGGQIRGHRHQVQGLRGHAWPRGCRGQGWGILLGWRG